MARTAHGPRHPPLLALGLALSLCAPPALAVQAVQTAQAEVAEIPLLRLCLPDLEAAPYLRSPKDGPGLIEQIVLDAARSTGMKILVHRAPTKRCQLDFEQGHVDSLIGGWNSMTQRLGRFPMKGDAADRQRRVARIPMVWIQRKSHPLAWDGNRFFMPSGQLADVGVLRNMVMLAMPLRALGYRVEDSSMSAHQLLLQLQGRRIDAAVCMADQILREFDHGEFAELEMLPRTLTQVDYYLIVTAAAQARAPRHVEALWDAISRFRELPRTVQ